MSIPLTQVIFIAVMADWLLCTDICIRRGEEVNLAIVNGILAVALHAITLSFTGLLLYGLIMWV